MQRQFTLLAAALSCGAASTAPTLFAVDAFTSTLVRVNATTGYVVAVGPLSLGSGTGVVNDLASDGDRLFALTSIYPNGAFVGEVNPSTGAAMSSAPLTVDGVNAINAVEGLAVDADGRLVVSLWRPSSSSASSSNNLGSVALTGQISGVIDFGPDADFDGLGSDPDGNLIGLDRTPNIDVRFHRVSYAPSSSTFIGGIPIPGSIDNVDDCAVLGGDIITFDRDLKRMTRHNRTTGAPISFINYTAAYSIYMLTVVDVCLGDVDGDSFIGFADLNQALGAFNTANGNPAYDGASDLDIDGDVDFADLNLLLSAFNTSCP